MNFNLKLDTEEQDHQGTHPSQLFLSSHHHHHHHQQHDSSSSSSSPSTNVLPLFVPEPTCNLSALSSDTTTKFPRGMGSYFSLSQWQELELQALIFRHMIAGAAVPPELLHLVKKSLVNSSSNGSPYYPPSQHFYPLYQPALVQSGYWGRAAMDPEPGRCRRTDGKKWRCSRDVVAGQKYCERHMHRGRNRSRKPVEIPTSTPYGATRGGGPLKTESFITTQGVTDAGARDTPHFSLSRPSSSSDLLYPNQRPSDFTIETKGMFGAQNDGRSDGRTLQHFFDDWPQSLHETENAASAAASATNLSISLKLGTGNGDEYTTDQAAVDDNKPQLNWGMAPWEGTRAGPMGGPLAEALRSSTSNSSPTSVLHRLARGLGASEASYVSA